VILRWLAGTFWLASFTGAQTPDSLPFAIGERLTYSVRSAKLGTVGQAVMAVGGPVTVRGTPAVVASFTVAVRVAYFVRGSNVSRSWIDASHLASLRFTKHEHRPLLSEDDSVEIFPAGRRWLRANGDSGATATNAPLDALSFLFFLRTLPLVIDTIYSSNRFYDQRRIPTTVHVIRRDTLTTPAGKFRTALVEMRLADALHDGKGSVVRVWLSDDHWRIPVRMETSMALLGTGVFTLQSIVHGASAGARVTPAGPDSAAPPGGGAGSAGLPGRVRESLPSASTSKTGGPQ
jgi:hypothetical protein